MSTDRDRGKGEESSVERMLRASASIPHGIAGRLEEAGPAEVARQSRKARGLRRLWRPTPVIAAAAALVAAVLFAYRALEGPSVAGQISRLYGIVTLADGGAPQVIAGTVPLPNGHRVFTEWGSRARIDLSDKSMVRTRPHSRLVVNQTGKGALIELEEGAIDITAAKQKAGKALVVETPDAEIKILGTVLTVGTSETAGVKRTRVTVDSGSVTLMFAGKSVTVVPNAAGIVEDAQAPVVQALVPEVDEVSRLIRLTRASARPGVKRACPR